MMMPQDNVEMVWYECETCGHKWLGPMLDVEVRYPLGDGELKMVPSVAITPFEERVANALEKMGMKEAGKNTFVPKKI